MVKLIRGLAARLALGGAIAFAPAFTAAETLRDAMIGAYYHSGLLTQNRALLRAADEGVAEQIAALRPIINYTVTFSRSNRNSVSGRNSSINFSSFGTSIDGIINARLRLWDGNRSKLAIESAKETVLATRQQLISIEQRVLLGAVNAYFSVREATENVALRQSNLRLITQELRAAEDRFEVGEVTRTDVAQAEARLAEARSGLASAMGALVQAQEAYAEAVGRKPGQLAVPGKLPKLTGSIPQAKDIGVRNHPDLRQVQHQVAALELTVEQAERSALPTLDLTGRLQQSQTFGTDEYVDSAAIGLELSGPIYQGGALASATRAAIAQRDAQRGNLHVARHTIRRGVGDAYAQYQVATAQLQATAERIRAARVAFRGVREEATLGARTTLDVLNAEQALLDAQAAQIAAQANRYVAAYTVLSAMGRLTVSDLRLGIKQYDPNAYYNLVKDAPLKRSKQGAQLDRVLKSLQKD